MTRSLYLNTKLLTGTFFLIALLVPFVSFGASSKVTCELEATTNQGTVDLKNKSDVVLAYGEEIEITWDSSNAKKAKNLTTRKSIELDGEETLSPKRTTTYKYQFLNGSKKAQCEVTVEVVKASIKDAPIATMVTKPTISGKVTEAKTVTIEIYAKDAKKPLFTSKNIKVKKDAWSTKVSKTLKKGTYTLLLRGEKDWDLNILATTTLTIGSKEVAVNTKDATTFVVESVPLLVGGIAKKSQTIPVSYLQIINIGNKEGKVESLTVKQNGSAPFNSLTSLSVFNEQGFISSIDASEFKSSTIVVPVNIQIVSKQMQLLTVKATLANNASAYNGTQLKLDVSGVTTNSKMQSKFPILGTTWTIGN